MDADPLGKPAARDVSSPLWAECEPCGGVNGANVGCPACHGLGRVRVPDPRDGSTPPPDCLAPCAEVLELYAAAKRWGLSDAMRMLGIEELHPAAIEALDLLDAEMHRLEHEREVMLAERERKRHANRRTP